MMSNISALSHLVEAASALSELVDPSAAAAVGGPLARTIPVMSKVVQQQQQPPKRPHSQTATKKPAKRDIFPKQLMDILSDTSLSDIISWLPHGLSFVIIRPDIFIESVLPKFLPPVDNRASTKYPSFTRKLNRWGFRQATKGPDTGAFRHDLFRRDQPDLCLQMVCQKNKDRQQRQRKNLPPKKRAIAEASKKGGAASEAATATQRRTSNTTATPQSAMAQHPRLPPPPANVSADERSQGSSLSRSSSGSVLATNNGSVQPSTPSTVTVAAGKESPSPALIPYISNDQAFVQETLRQRDRAEVLRAARAMLYESYMKALVSKSNDQAN